MLIKAADLKFNPLEDAVIDDIAPPIWNGPHVGNRLAEAFRTLAALPADRIRTTSGCWPAYAHDWQDLLAQQEQLAEEKAQASAQQNRARVAPSLAAISRMERAIYWPACYLASSPTVARATNAIAFAIAFDRDIASVARRYGGKVRRWQTDYVDGCEVIAINLIRNNDPVF